MKTILERSLATVKRIWPPNEDFDEEDDEALRLTFQWLFEIAGLAGEVINIVHPANCELQTGEDWSKDHLIHIGVVADHIVIKTVVMTSLDTKTGHTAYYAVCLMLNSLSWELRRTDLRLETRFDALNSSLSAAQLKWTDTESARNALHVFARHCSALIEALDWFVSVSRPSRRDVHRCLTYVLSWALSLAGLAVQVQLGVDLLQECHSLKRTDCSQIKSIGGGNQIETL
jgi:hypothetical protein